MNQSQSNWEAVGPQLHRIAVPGGWIYQSEIETQDVNGSYRPAVAMCFVPQPENSPPNPKHFREITQTPI